MKVRELMDPKATETAQNQTENKQSQPTTLTQLRIWRGSRVAGQGVTMRELAKKLTEE
jgi:hypothetical protein